MAEFSTPMPNAGSLQNDTFAVKPAIVLALAALADWLFYGQRIGISAVVFAIALACGALLANFAPFERMADPREPHHLDGNALHLLAGQPCVDDRGIQCQP